MTPEQRKDVVSYRLASAKDLLVEIRSHIERGFYNTAMNRMYYACFHMVSSLLIQRGIEVKSHKGVRQAFGFQFVRTGVMPMECGRIFSKIYDKRQASDYDDFRTFTQEEIDSLYPEIKFLIGAVDELIEKEKLVS